MISWMQTHRKYLVVTIWISTIAFVGAGFVGWGAYSFNADKAGAVAKVGDTVVQGKDLQNTYGNIYNYYNQLMGGKLTQEKADALKLKDIALDQLIKQTLLLNYAQELGLDALESEVAGEIHAIDQFKANGVFDKQTYFKALKAINKEPKDFESSIKKEIILNKLSQSLQMPNTALELETLTASRFMQDQISAKIIDVKSSDINVSDDLVKSFWEQNKVKYMSEKSYTVDLIKVASADMSVDENETAAFYEENKQSFKDKEDKILSLDAAKAEVVAAVKLKKAKKEILKKHLEFKDGKIKAQERLTLSAKESVIPLEKIVSAKVNDWIKSIELKDGYATAQLISIEEPKALEFEKAKALARNDYIQSQKMTLLESRAKAESANLKDAKPLGYLTREDANKVAILGENEAAVFLEQLFSKAEKKGFYLFSDKAVVYEIIDQNLTAKVEDGAKKEELQKMLMSIKNSTMQNMLIKQLEKKYAIEKYIKG